MTRGEPSYFFDKGIRFGCTQCGRCCTGTPGEVDLTRDELRAIARVIGETEASVRRRHCRTKGKRLLLKEKPNGDCVFYENGCTVYRARPAQCRTYPFWVSNMRTEEDWADTRAECPGIGKGRMYRRSEILRILQRSPV